MPSREFAASARCDDGHKTLLEEQSKTPWGAARERILAARDNKNRNKKTPPLGARYWHQARHNYITKI